MSFRAENDDGSRKVFHQYTTRYESHAHLIEVGYWTRNLNTQT